MDRRRIRAAVLASSLVVLVPAAAPAQQEATLQSQRTLVRQWNAFGDALASAAAPAALENHALAPAGVSLVLLLALQGAGGLTAAELQQRLAPVAFDPRRVQDAAIDLVRRLREAAAAEGGVDLRVALGAWLQRGAPLRDDYVRLLRDRFGAAVEALDFAADPEVARRTIDERVAAATNGRIRELLPKGSLHADTRLVLTSALWLRARWQDAFDPHRTRERSFRLESGETVQVPTMERLGPCLTWDTPLATFVRLPYRGGSFAMDLALPKADAKADANAGGADAPARLDGSALLARLDPAAASGRSPGHEGLRETEVELRLPRFSIERRQSLRAALQSCGLQAMFSPEADFTGIGGERGSLFVGDVLQQVLVTVGEEGTEAVAATAQMAEGKAHMSAPPVIAFDRPFFVRIVDLRTGLVLVAGRVADPRG